MSKRKIKENINRIKSEIKSLQSYNNIEGYKELNDKLYKMKDEYNKKIYPELERMCNEMYILQDEYKKPVKEKLIVPKHLQDWFIYWGRGMDFGYSDPYIKWISDDEKYVIITCPGGTSGQGTAMGTSSYYYSQTQHYLIRTLEGAQMFDRIKSKIVQYEGRLTKEKFNEWKELIKTL